MMWRTETFLNSLWSHIWCFSASLNIHLFVIFHKWIGKKCRNFRLGFLKSTLILFIWPGYLLQEGGSTLWYEAYYKQTDKLLVIYCMVYTYTRYVYAYSMIMLCMWTCVYIQMFKPVKSYYAFTEFLFVFFCLSLFFSPQRCGRHTDCKINDPCIEVSNRCKRES